MTPTKKAQLTLDYYKMLENSEDEDTEQTITDLLTDLLHLLYADETFPHTPAETDELASQLLGQAVSHFLAELEMGAARVTT